MNINPGITPPPPYQQTRPSTNMNMNINPGISPPLVKQNIQQNIQQNKLTQFPNTMKPIYSS